MFTGFITSLKPHTYIPYNAFMLLAILCYEYV